MKTPLYVTISDFKCSYGSKWVDIPAGTFAKIIDIYYVPKHLQDTLDYRCFDGTTEVYIYTRYGITLIPKKQIRRVE